MMLKPLEYQPKPVWMLLYKNGSTSSNNTIFNPTMVIFQASCYKMGTPPYLTYQQGPRWVFFLLLWLQPKPMRATRYYINMRQLPRDMVICYLPLKCCFVIGHG